PAREATRPKICIAATGGYGRRELCPYSDIDVTFVVAEEEDEYLDAVVRQMFMTIMEVFKSRCGLKVGYGYRTVSGADQLDHQTQTALLDLRVVAGSHRLGEEFRREVLQHIWPASFLRTKLEERVAQRARLGGTVHQVEPELREGPGGLRDIHLAEWLAATSFPSTRGDVWHQLQRLGAVSPRDVQAVTEAREFLLTVRNWAHWQTERLADRLVRDRQEAVAVALHCAEDGRVSRVERFMEQYYRAAENSLRVSGFVADRCLAERLSLSEELACSGSELFVAYPWVRAIAPRFLMEMAQHFQSHGLHPGHELRRILSQQLEQCPELGEDPEACQDFMGLLRAVPTAGRRPVLEGGEPPPGVYNTLRMLADLGLLQRLLPELGEAYRRVPFDPAHRHSIGFHLLETVRCLERLRFTQDPALDEFRKPWSAVRSPEILYLAALLHDIGKLVVGIPHPEAGAEMAHRLCRRLGLDDAAADAVVHLVRIHMVMSDTAQLRDLTLEKTLHDFCEAVGS
ncbi:MAG: HD domain-containing protein, partial [SAR202 cluster bacterium]|nr:HD domain-containing protein [SAR202 cluster bacterium]